MALDALFYPHALSLNGVLIQNIEEHATGYNYTDAYQRAGSDPAPCFVAKGMAEPEARFSTKSAKPFLDMLVADTNGRETVSSLAGGAGAIMYFQKGRPFSLRHARSESVHYTAAITDNTMVVMDRITARQNQDLQIDFRLIVGRESGSDPLVWTGTSTLPAYGCDSLYSMGPVRIDGTLLPGVTSWVYELNPVPDRRPTSGEFSASYVGTETFMPKLMITTDSLTSVSTYAAFAGAPYTVVDAFAKRRRTENAFYDNTDTEHIQLSLKPGKIVVTDVAGSPAETSIEACPAADSGDAQLRSHLISTAVAHPVF